MMHRFCANREHSNVLLLALEQSGATLDYILVGLSTIEMTRKRNRVE